MRHIHRLDLRPSMRLTHLPIWIAAALVAGGIAALVLVRVNHVVKGRGTLVHTLNDAQVATQRSGVVVEILSADGALVTAGQPLLRLDDREDRAALTSLERQLAATKDELAERTRLRDSRRQLTETKLRLIASDRAATQAALAGVEADARRLADDIVRWQHDLERNTALARQKAATQAEVEAAAATLRKAQSEKAGVESDLSQKKVQIARFDEQERQTSLDSSIEEQQDELLILKARRDLAALERTAEETRLRLERAIVPAPVTGVVHALSVQAVGELVAERQVVCRLVPPTSNLIAEVELPSGDIGFVREGQRARIKLDAFPFEDYGAFEGEVALVAADASPTAADSRERKPSYVVRVRIDEKQQAAGMKKITFRPGMTLTAELVNRRETLGELLFRPLRAAGSELHVDQTENGKAAENGT